MQTVQTVQTVPSDQWISLGDGIEAVEVLGFAVHPEEPERLVVLTPDGMFARRADGTWAASSSGLGADQGSVWGHIVSNSITKGYESDDQLFAIVKGRLYESDDFGGNWRDISGTGPGSTEILTRRGTCGDALAGIRQDPTDPERIFAGTIAAAAAGHREGGLFLTEDGGATWARLAGEFLPDSPCGQPWEGPDLPDSTPVCAALPGMKNDAWPIAFDFLDGTRTGVQGFYSGTTSLLDGLRRSHDGGQSWTKYADPFLCQLSTRDIEYSAAAAGGSGAFFAAVYDYVDQRYRVLWSRDAESWNPTGGDSGTTVLEVDDSGQVWALADGSIRRWSDAAAGFEEVAVAPGGARSLVVRLDPATGEPSVYVGSDGGGVWRLDGGDWVNLTGGLEAGAADVRFIRQIGTSALLASADGIGLHLFRSGAAAWERLGPPIAAAVVDADVTEDLTGAVVTDGGTISFLGSGSASWEARLVVPAGARSIEAVALDPTDRSLLYAVWSDRTDGNTYLARLRDDGTRLTIERATPVPADVVEAFPFLYAPAGASGSVFFATWVDGVAPGSDVSGLWVSRDRGDNLSAIALGSQGGRSRQVHPMRLSPDGTTLLMTAWETRTSGAWTQTLQMLPVGQSVPVPVSTQAQNAGIGSDWVWIVAFGGDPPARFAGFHRLRFNPFTVLCAEGMPESLLWQEVDRTGLPAEAGTARSMSMLPPDGKVIVISTRNPFGVHARRVFQTSGEAPRVCVTE